MSGSVLAWLTLVACSTRPGLADTCSTRAGSHFDYREVKPDTDPKLFEWREKFNAVCESFGVKPAAVCVQFSFLFPEIKSVALATSRPDSPPAYLAPCTPSCIMLSRCVAGHTIPVFEDHAVGIKR